jgi:hypothetical protein
VLLDLRGWTMINDDLDILPARDPVDHKSKKSYRETQFKEESEKSSVDLRAKIIANLTEEEQLVLCKAIVKIEKDHQEFTPDNIAIALRDQPLEIQEALIRAIAKAEETDLSH